MLETSSIHHPAYNEAKALEQLLKASLEAVQDESTRLDNDDYMLSEFTINIAGQSIAFILGGPQLVALDKFIEHIAEENLYEVDFKNNAVLE